MHNRLQTLKIKCIFQIFGTERGISYSRIFVASRHFPCGQSQHQLIIMGSLGDTALGRGNMVGSFVTIHSTADVLGFLLYSILYLLNPDNWLMKHWLKLRYNLYKTKLTPCLPTYCASYKPILVMLFTFHNQHRWKNIYIYYCLIFKHK